MTDRNLHLWWASVAGFEGLIGHLLAKLPAKEHERALRFRIDGARHRFVLGRTVLRRCLGAGLDLEPGTLEFASGIRGKPHLAAPEIGGAPFFNLSHSGMVVVIALSPSEVGIDVESLREIPNADRMARRFFSPKEQSIINTLCGTKRDHAFLRIWTQKEAYLKATGLGVGMPLREVETEPDPRAQPRLLAVTGDRQEAECWSLLNAKVPGAVCTVAVRGPEPRLDVQRFTPADL